MEIGEQHFQKCHHKFESSLAYHKCHYGFKKDRVGNTVEFGNSTSEEAFCGKKFPA